MKLLVTGKGKSGSWQIRGIQLGGALKATIVPQCTAFDAFDTIVYVKRVTRSWLAGVRRAGRSWIWDIVDAWPQPGGNSWDREQAIKWLKHELEDLRPSAVVFPTQQMRLDSEWKGPSLVLPHHAWPKYRRTAARDKPVLVVGYEGGHHYLGEWEPLLLKECGSRGWVFMHNGDMQQADIGVALRHQTGYPAMHWKSNCKLANLQALGIPAICGLEVSYKEFSSGVEHWVTSPLTLEIAFRQLAPYEQRRRDGEIMYNATPTLQKVAEEYRQWLIHMKF